MCPSNETPSPISAKTRKSPDVIALVSVVVFILLVFGALITCAVWSHLQMKREMTRVITRNPVSRKAAAQQALRRALSEEEKAYCLITLGRWDQLDGSCPSIPLYWALGDDDPNIRSQAMERLAMGLRRLYGRGPFRNFDDAGFWKVIEDARSYPPQVRMTLADVLITSGVFDGNVVSGFAYDQLDGLLHHGTEEARQIAVRVLAIAGVGATNNLVRAYSRTTLGRESDEGLRERLLAAIRDQGLQDNPYFIKNVIGAYHWIRLYALSKHEQGELMDFIMTVWDGTPGLIVSNMGERDIGESDDALLSKILNHPSLSETGRSSIARALVAKMTDRHSGVRRLAGKILSKLDWPGELPPCVQLHGLNSTPLRDAIRRLLSAGEGIPGAAALAEGSPASYVIIVTEDGEEHRWNASMPDHWHPISLGQLELVVSVKDGTKVLYSGDYAQRGKIDFTQDYADVRIVAARSGKTLGTRTYLGPFPKYRGGRSEQSLAAEAMKGRPYQVRTSPAPEVLVIGPGSDPHGAPIDPTLIHDWIKSFIEDPKSGDN